MNQVIKKRIEDINNGIVPEGYKQTPFGIFPCDWEAKSMNQICDIYSGGTPSTKKEEYWDGDIPWCCPTDITKSNKYIEKTYKEKMKEEITKGLKEKGYYIEYLKLYIETEDEKVYGQINSMIAKVYKNDKNEELKDESVIKNEISAIQNIEILNNVDMMIKLEKAVYNHLLEVCRNAKKY